MPVYFLTAIQQQGYGRYVEEPSPEQRARYFHLDDTDRRLIATKRRDYNRLGFALQLGTVRFLGTFLPNPIEVPPGVIAYVARQLEIADWSSLPQYMGRPTTRSSHVQEIRAAYGYRDFHDQPGHFRLVRWLYTRAWLSTERPSVLFDLATAWLVQHKIVLPGATTLARLIARIRDRADQRLWRLLASLPDQQQRERLLALLQTGEEENVTPLDRLRRGPTRLSGPELVRALRRLEEVRALEIRDIDLSNIPAARVNALARYAIGSWASSIARLRPDRRIATLLAFAHQLEAISQDDALDLLDQLVTDKFNQAVKEGQQERLQTLAHFDAAASRLREACLMLLDENLWGTELHHVIFGRISREELVQATHVVGERSASRPPHHYDQLLKSYRSIRRFMPALLKAIAFQGTASSRALLNAWEFLYRLDHEDPKPHMEEAPQDIVHGSWRSLVFGGDARIDRRYYTFCVLQQLQENLHRRDAFVVPSHRWYDPRAQLLQGQAWESARARVCRTLGWSTDGKAEVTRLSQIVDEAYRRTAARFAQNPAAHIENKNGRDRLVLTPLSKLEEPETLITLRQQVADLLPSANLPDVMLEIHRLTGFGDEFTHLTEHQAQVEDLPISLCAVLLAEACNIGLQPLVRSDIPALTSGRLLWVQQNYIRAETLTRANARLVDAQADIPLAHAWGGGEVASADGLRFVVAVHTLHAAPSSKYFGTGRGITYYDFTSDQFTGFHGIVIPGAVREALYILDGLLEQQTSLRPVEIMTDTAGYTDIVFGLFWLLGYQFSPRLADIGSARFWRIDPQADYGSLNALARQRINTQLIVENWDDLLRVAGSLKLGTVSASNLMRTLQAPRRLSTLARAIGELGRIAKTLYLLDYIDDEAYRRRILTQINRGEGRHSLARAVCYGRRGEIRKPYREGQEDQLNALGLVLNILVLWNTRYMDLALSHLRTRGETVRPEDVARLSPLKHKHINLLGRYEFTLPEALQHDEVRPLRDVTEPERTFA